MDEFREWLSDNLRYFMLGGIILVIVAALFFGIRACVGGKKSSGGSGTEQGTEGSPSSDGEGTSEENESNPLQTASSEVTDLINRYYDALGSKDVDQLKAIEVNFNEEDGEKIINSADYIEEYKVKDVYTKNGLSEESYVVYASFEYKCKDIDTLVPALSQLYVITDEDGELKIDASANTDSTISNYVKQLQNDDDVQALTKKIRDAYEQAQQDDPDLAAFLSQLGTDTGSEGGETGEDSENTMTVTASSVNVRSEASTYGNILGSYPEGSKVVPLGETDGWIQVDYNGQTGYIYSDYLQ